MVSQVARDDPAGVPQLLCNLRVTLHGLHRSVEMLDEGGREIPVRNDGHIARVSLGHIDFTGDGVPTALEDPAHEGHDRCGFSRNRIDVVAAFPAWANSGQ